jgi:hypothetical protein
LRKIIFGKCFHTCWCLALLKIFLVWPKKLLEFWKIISIFKFRRLFSEIEFLIFKPYFLSFGKWFLFSKLVNHFSRLSFSFLNCQNTARLPPSRHRATVRPSPGNTGPPTSLRHTTIETQIIRLFFYINIFMLWIKIDFYRLIWFNENIKNICDFPYTPNVKKYF